MLKFFHLFAVGRVFVSNPTPVSKCLYAYVAIQLHFQFLDGNKHANSTHPFLAHVKFIRFLIVILGIETRLKTKGVGANLTFYNKDNLHRNGTQNAFTSRKFFASFSWLLS